MRRRRRRMAEHDKTPVVFGARMARDADDRMIGYEAYRAERGKTRYDAKVTVIGVVRAEYAEASQDAKDAHDKEFGVPHFERKEES
jgi:hypothetical protein